MAGGGLPAPVSVSSPQTTTLVAVRPAVGVDEVEQLRQGWSGRGVSGGVEDEQAGWPGVGAGLGGPGRGHVVAEARAGPVEGRDGFGEDVRGRVAAGVDAEPVGVHGGHLGADPDHVDPHAV